MQQLIYDTYLSRCIEPSFTIVTCLQLVYHCRDVLCVCTDWRMSAVFKSRAVYRVRVPKSNDLYMTQTLAKRTIPSKFLKVKRNINVPKFNKFMSTPILKPTYIVRYKYYHIYLYFILLKF